MTTGPAPHGAPPYGQPPTPYAHWGLRVASLAIDVALFYVPMLLLVLLFGVLGLIDENGDPAGVVANGLVSVVGLLTLGFAVVNRLVLDGRNGQSIGRRITRTRLVSLQTGRPIGVGRALLRQLCHLVDTATFYVGYLLPLFTRERQTIADMVLKTVVVRTTAGGR
ncbi:MAG: RDD family protein [Streptosporangiales bacterium]|nr:RDD family protein [Streptosporangiales bacterium]